MYKVGRSRTPQGVRGLKPLYLLPRGGACWSHSARSAWIETERSRYLDACPLSRTPQGVRGLKQYEGSVPGHEFGRTPQGVRGLKPRPRGFGCVDFRRTPQGVRGLKRPGWCFEEWTLSRTPQGVRGLKPFICFPVLQPHRVALRKEGVD